MSSRRLSAAQRAAARQFHHQKWAALSGLAVVKKRCNTRMTKFGNGACFAQEALSQGIVLRESVRENFEGHRPAQSRVMSSIDFAHPACAQTGNNLVWTESCSGREFHVFRIEAKISI